MIAVHVTLRMIRIKVKYSVFLINVVPVIKVGNVWCGVRKDQFKIS